MAFQRINNCSSELEKFNQEIELHKVSSSFTEKKQNGKYTGKFSPSKKARL